MRHHTSDMTQKTCTAKTKKACEALGEAKVKDDSLLREQLPAWLPLFEASGIQQWPRTCKRSY